MKELKMKYFLLAFCLVFVSLSALSQGVEDETIIVVKPYQATLSDAFKISETPLRDTSRFNVPELKYSINTLKAATEYTVPEIKPVKIKDEAIPKLYKSYLKGGVGNYATRYGEFFFNSLRSRNYTAGIRLKHMSSQGTMKDATDPSYSENYIKAHGERFFDKSTLSGELSFDRDVINYYGYNPTFFEDTIINPKQRFDYFDIAANFKNNSIKKDRFDYNAGVKYYYVKDKFENIEKKFDLNLLAATTFDQFYVGLNPEISIINYSDQLYDYKNNIFNIRPFASTKVEALDITAGIKLTGVSFGHGTKFNIFPDINAEFKLVDNYLILFAGVTGGVKPNTFRKLTETNPFYLPNAASVISPFVIHNSMALNSEIKLDFTGGVKGTFTNSTSYQAWINYKNVNAMPLFINHYDTFTNIFVLTYDDVNVLNIHGELGFHTSEKVRLIAKGDFYSYTMSAEDHPWHKPATEITLTGHYNLADKILLKGDIFYVGKRFAKNVVDLSLINNEHFEMKGYADLNLGVDYRYTKILSFFVNFNNITASKYQYWNHYPTQRFNILGGLTFAF